VLLLTGATGWVGTALRARLLERGIPVRCLVRDPRRLGKGRVDVQIALGDLGAPSSFRNALRGVDTVVHLAATTRDDPSGSIEEINGIATWRLVEAAERAGVRRFVFFSSLGAATHGRTRLQRSKALAERAVLESGLAATVLAPSFMYAAGDPWVTLVQRLSVLPVLPLSGRGRARFQPLWTHDAADCALAALDRAPERPERLELAGPETLTHRQMAYAVAAAAGRPRRVVRVPTPLVSRTLRLLETAMKSKAPATWDEAELLEVSMTSARGTADAEALGVRPRAIADVLGRP
jgi:NADH dehydrogenase